MSSIMYLSLYKIDIDVSSSHIPSYFQIQGACRACESKIRNYFFAHGACCILTRHRCFTYYVGHPDDG